MNTLRKWTPITLSVLAITAYSVAITSSVNAQEKSAGTVRMMVHKQLSIIPGPQSGIKLIEYISSKIRSSKGPVIAKNAPYRAQQVFDDDAGPTNKVLAIKPPTTSYVPRESSADAASNRREPSAKKSRVAGKLMPAEEKKAAADKDREDDSSTGRRSVDFMFKKKAEAQAEVASAKQQSNAYGRAKMPEGVKPLGTAIANLSGALTRADSLMQTANEAERSTAYQQQMAKAKSPARSQTSYTIASNSARQAGLMDQNFFRQRGEAQILGPGPIVRDARASAEEVAPEGQAQSPPLPAASYRSTHVPTAAGRYVYSPGDNAYAPGTAGSAGNGIREYKPRGALLNNQPGTSFGAAAPAPSQTAPMVPPPPPTVASASAPAALPQGGFSGEKSLHMAAQAPKADLVAMLPPNVITGIPLVRLGSSAEDASRALASLKGNRIEKQSISGWTVFILHKANSAEPAMHVYMRHGLVEALRIFDSAYIAPDFGVQLNDDLRVMKAKFGEPAFMKDEPECPKSTRIWNYVYPISQVSFEVAQLPSSSQPKVISILIFTVK